MSDDEGSRRLSEKERQVIRRALLRESSGSTRKIVGRIGRVISYPPREEGDVRRYRFGMGMLGLAGLVIVTFFILPNDERRWLFMGAAGVMAGIGAWQIDKANRPDSAKKDDRGAG
jgi:hypothetical protein